MSRDSNGTYTAPSNSWNPAVEGEVIDETDWNTTLQDVEDALTDSVSRTGKGSVSAHIDFDENASPGTPSANVARLYAADNGSGTTVMKFRDSNGTDYAVFQVVGVDVQAWDADLDAIAALAKTDGNFIVGNGTTWVAESGATARTSLGLAIGTDVQAYDAGLADIAGLAVTDGNIIVGDGANWVAESGATARASLGLTIGTDVQAYDADTLKADTADTLTAGFDATAYSAGTKSSGTYTPSPADGNFQTATNGGAHTLAPPGSTCSIVIQYTNNGSAGTITTSGFTLVSGDTPTTTNGDDFFAYIVQIGSFSHLTWVALQ